MSAEDATADLVVRAQRGEPGAFQALAQRHLRAAYAVALAVVGRPADAEDVSQDAFVLALEHIESCREPARFAGWLLQIVRNQARNWLDRRRLRDVPANDQTTDPTWQGASVDEVALRGPLLRALLTLPNLQREIVLLHDLEGWTHPEIAAAVGVSEVASRQHLFQARRELRARLEDRQPDGGGS